MKLNKWVIFRIILVFIYILFFSEIILFKFASIQLRNQLIIGIIFMILFAIILGGYILHLFNETFPKRNQFKYFSSRKRNKYKYVPKKYNSIIDFMSTQKLRNYAIAYFVLLTSFVLNIFSSNYWSKNISMWSNLLILIIMLLMFINIVILEYRIGNKYYGTNDYEAREIINFILNNIGNIDLDSDDHFKKLFTDVQNDIDYITNGSLNGYKGIID